MSQKPFPDVRAALLAVVLCTAGAAAPGSAQDGGALSILEAAAVRYRASSTLCADFRQELSIPLLHEQRSGHGRLCQKQPNLFMMRFADPGGDEVVADGTWLWIYFPSSDPKQVLRAPLGSAPGAFDFHREFLENPAEKYEARLAGEETLEGSRVHRIVLTPKRPVGYQEAVVWVDVSSQLVRRVETREENGSVRTVSLSNIELGASPGADAFHFDPPPGAQVITR